MNRFFYSKLALTNIKKNGKSYIPYIFACIGTIIMYYNIHFCALSKSLSNFTEARILRTLLIFGTAVTALFSIIFLFYTNSFLIKRRKKEFGLFNILGMEKRHIGKIIFLETVFIYLICITSGILFGILFSKLTLLILFKILSFKVSFGFEIPKEAVFYTFILFTGIFILNILNNLFQVYRSKPIELLKGGKIGEKEPKTKGIIAIIGAISLGIGYYIALTTKSPLKALNKFFLAVILVIIGTYCLFTAGSIALLKIMRKNKRYYYKPKHFISVSSMIYRMKQNAIGLANICILATTVIFLISTTVSLYVGMDEALKTRYPKEIAISANNISDEQAEQLTSVIKEELKKANITEKNVVHYRPMTFAVNQNEETFSSIVNKYVFDVDNFSTVTFITVDDYNKMENKSETLSKNEALLYIIHGNISGNTLNFNGHKFSIKKRISSMVTEGILSAIIYNSYYVVVDSMDTINEVYKSLEGKDKTMEQLSYLYSFDVDANEDTQIKFTSTLENALKKLNLDFSLEGRESSRQEFFNLYGILFFLGIFLGLVFIMATVLIIYYKQIAEGYDDKERFEILQKVGMSSGEVKKIINSQVLKVFFLPLIAAIIHIAFAFKIITKLLSVFNLTNIPLFAVCTAATILVFAFFYALVYGLTAKTYYKIVSK